MHYNIITNQRRKGQKLKKKIEYISPGIVKKAKNICKSCGKTGNFQMDDVCRQGIFHPRQLICLISVLKITKMHLKAWLQKITTMDQRYNKPTSQNLTHTKIKTSSQEPRQPKKQKYHIYFSSLKHREKTSTCLKITSRLRG